GTPGRYGANTRSVKGMRGMSPPGTTVRSMTVAKLSVPAIARRISRLVLGALVLACAPAASAGTPPLASAAPLAAGDHAPPSDLRDVNAWGRWKTDEQLMSRPLEARRFYRRGLIARQSGQAT